MSYLQLFLLSSVQQDGQWHPENIDKKHKKPHVPALIKYFNHLTIKRLT